MLLTWVRPLLLLLVFIEVLEAELPGLVVYVPGHNDAQVFLLPEKIEEDGLKLVPEPLFQHVDIGEGPQDVFVSWLSFFITTFLLRVLLALLVILDRVLQLIQEKFVTSFRADLRQVLEEDHVAEFVVHVEELADLLHQSLFADAPLALYHEQ